MIEITDEMVEAALTSYWRNRHQPPITAMRAALAAALAGRPVGEPVGTITMPSVYRAGVHEIGEAIIALTPAFERALERMPDVAVPLYAAPAPAEPSSKP